MQAILIDVAARDVRTVAYAGLLELQDFVGGYITAARSWPSGDVLFVDDEGLFKPQAGFFRIEGVEHPLAGNGVIVGPERLDQRGEYLGTHPPGIGLDALRTRVRFLTHNQMRAWGLANASEPAIGSVSVMRDGRVEHTVISRLGKLYKEIPMPPGEERS